MRGQAWTEGAVAWEWEKGTGSALDVLISDISIQILNSDQTCGHYNPNSWNDKYVARRGRQLQKIGICHGIQLSVRRQQKSGNRLAAFVGNSHMTETKIILSRTRRDTIGIFPQPARSPDRNFTMVKPSTRSWGRTAETLKRTGAAVRSSLRPTNRVLKRLTQKIRYLEQWWAACTMSRHDSALFCRWSQVLSLLLLRAMPSSHMRHDGLGYKEHRLWMR